MINIFLIRHGKASSGWNSLDPALDDFGKKQSKELAKKLLNYSSESYDLFSSPLLRCKQTSKPFRLLCNKDITIEDRVSEIPSPISDLSKRVIWLKRVLPLNWNELIDDKDSIASGLDYNLWRSGIIDFLYSLSLMLPLITYSKSVFSLLIGCLTPSIHHNTCGIFTLGYKVLFTPYGLDSSL